MDERRNKLHVIFEALAPHVYFAPPPSLKLQYPCIKYDMNNLRTEYAANLPYRLKKRYMVTIIDEDPDSTIPGQVAILPYASFNHRFQADNLNHDVYELYF